MTPQHFPPRGQVWSTTVVHIPVGNRTDPTRFTYVDLWQGPRILVRTSVNPESPAISIADHVEIIDVGAELSLCHRRPEIAHV